MESTTMEFSNTISKIAPALVKAQMEMGNAVKDAANPYFKSKYADLNAIREACLPVLNKHAITVLQPTVVMGGKNYVKTVLLHESGEYVYSITQIKVLKENDPQAEGSGISYARRYGLQSLVNLGAVDDDGEGAMARSAAPKPAAPPAPSSDTATPPKKTSSFRRPKEETKEDEWV